jgi:hypothetical protein
MFDRLQELELLGVLPQSSFAQQAMAASGAGRGDGAEECHAYGSGAWARLITRLKNIVDAREIRGRYYFLGCFVARPLLDDDPKPEI